MGFLEEFSFLTEAFAAVTWQHVVMWIIGGVLIFLAIVKKMEPSLLLPIGFGAILVNIPLSNVLTDADTGAAGIIQWLYETTIETSEALPILLFIGIGAMIDFEPLIRNPKLMVLGGFAQIGIFLTLLFAVLFDPLKDSQGLFPANGFQQERRQLLEMLDAEFNDKVGYAHQRCEEILFHGQNAGVGRCGSREDVEALDRAAVTAAWEEVLQNAQFEIFALGDCVPDVALFQERIYGLGKRQNTGSLPFEKPDQVRRVVEEQPLSQSKLSMGFRVDYTPEERHQFQLMAMVLGGVPSSKLFQNVREKMSLCYYCSSGLVGNSRSMFIESGVETSNLEKAEEAIYGQLSALQKGELTEEELLSAKLAYCNSLRSINDSLPAMESAYLGQVFSGLVLPQEESIARVMSCTKEQVVEAANRLVPGAVFTLKGSGVHG